jgi:hypothetical protein
MSNLIFILSLICELNFFFLILLINSFISIMNFIYTIYFRYFPFPDPNLTDFSSCSGIGGRSLVLRGRREGSQKGAAFSKDLTLPNEPG